MISQSDEGKTIQKIRLSKNISQLQLSNKICSQSYLSRIETGETRVTFNKIQTLLTTVNISLYEFDTLLHPQFFQMQAAEFFLHNLDVEQLSLFTKNNETDYLYFYINWLKNMFSIHIKTTCKREINFKIENILNQDIFFFHDLPFLVYNLHNLPIRTATYTYNRLLGQKSMNENILLHRPLHLNATLSIALLSIENSRLTDGIFHLKKGASDALAFCSINHIIIFNLFLYKYTKKVSFFENAIHAKDFFSKDKFYDYWYNTIID